MDSLRQLELEFSLISIYSTKCGTEVIEMHNSLQEMGRTIVQEQCIKDPSKRNKLFTNEDVYHVLNSNKVGAKCIQFCLFFFKKKIIANFR